jgi:hypothetical protein
VLDELQRLRSEKEEAIETGDFEQAASLRDRERRLRRAARSLSRAWDDEPEARAEPIAASPRGQLTYTDVSRPPRLFALGWALFGVSAAIGLLAGWLIWG